ACCGIASQSMAPGSKRLERLISVARSRSFITLSYVSPGHLDFAPARVAFRDMVEVLCDVSASHPTVRRGAHLHDSEGETMAFAEYAEYDGLGLAGLVAKGQVTPLELAEEAIARIEKYNSRLNAVVYKMYDQARETAQRVAGERDGRFRGVP